jgi:transposase
LITRWRRQKRSALRTVSWRLRQSRHEHRGLARGSCTGGTAQRSGLRRISSLCPRVNQSGQRDLRGPLSKQGPRYLRWALVEAATHACTHPIYRDRYQQTKARIGKQRGAKVAQIDLARRLSAAIWHMLSRNQPFAPKGATDPLAA